MIESLQEKNRFEFPAFLTAIFIWSAGLIPLYFPKARLWGFNHLLFAPDNVIYLYIVAGLAAILLFIPRVNDLLVRRMDRSALLFNDAPQFGRWVLLSTLFLPLFWFFRMPANFLGDGYTAILNVGNDIPIILKWSEIGAIGLVSVVAGLLPLSGVEGAVVAYALVSVISGGVTVFFFCALAHELSDNGSGRLFTLGLLIFSGWTLLFFGYAESYPVLWPLVSGYIYYSIRCLKGQSSILVPTILLAVAVIMHLQVVFFTLSYLVLFFSRGVGQRIYQSHRNYIIGALAISIMIGFAAILSQLQKSHEFGNHFIPLLTGRPNAPGYTLFSGPHLIDILNEIRLLIPLAPALILLGWKNGSGNGRDAIGRFLIAFALAGAIFILIIDPRLGLGRDWDLFALCGLGPMLLLVRRMGRGTEKVRRLFPGLIALSLIAVMPYFAVNLSYQPSIDYYQWLLRQDVSRSKAGMSQLRNYYTDLGQDSLATEINQEIVKAYPFIRRADKAVELAQAGRHEEALALADSLFAADPYSVESFIVRGLVRLKTGQYAAAINDLERAAELGQYNAQILINLAQAYFRVGKFDLSLESLRKAQKYDAQSLGVYFGMASAFYQIGANDSALVYMDKIIESDSSRTEIYWMAAQAAYRLQSADRTRVYLERYLELAPETSNRSEAERILKQLP
ncbi:MAG: hypothetical protein GY841_17815 [FCB group bacterium]|nr:hypothetical protein [FCB group bacterium]